MLIRGTVLGSLFAFIVHVVACGNVENAPPSPVSDGGEDSAPSRPPPSPRTPNHVDAVDGASPTDSPSSSSWCVAQGTHTFCSDFDGPGLLDGWDGVAVTSVSSLDDVEAVTSDRSPPTALAITAAPGGPIDAPTLNKHISLPNAFSTATVGFDLRVVDTGLDADTYEIVPMVLAMTRDTASEHVTVASAHLGVRLTETDLDAYGALPNDASFGASADTKLVDLPRDSWVRVELTVSVDSTGHGRARASYDGKAAGEVDLGVIDGAGRNAVDLELGDAFVQLHPRKTSLLFDNVLLDVN